MEKMFIDYDNLDPTHTGRMGLNELERAQSHAGIVTYRCKVYRARLDQGKLGRKTAMFNWQNGPTREGAPN